MIRVILMMFIIKRALYKSTIFKHCVVLPDPIFSYKTLGFPKEDRENNGMHFHGQYVIMKLASAIYVASFSLSLNNRLQ